MHTRLNSTISPAAILPIPFWEIAPVATEPELTPPRWSGAGNVLYPSIIADARGAVHIASSEQRTEGDKVPKKEIRDPIYNQTITIPGFSDFDIQNVTTTGYVYYTVVEPGSAPRTEVVGKSAAKNDM